MYIHNLDEIPEKHKDFFRKENALIEKAFSNPCKLVRKNAGSYYVVINSELIAIDHPTDEVGSKAEWIAAEQSPVAKWYSDPHPTLKSLKKELGICLK